ncbi:HIT family protein [Halosolutus amylolyticus]|uniref:HIT family protein n=1 Tax=Halosolutus amylolyticus TaxID=2932267 RepID=A0ABD5PQY5_9EURY|nr:HIT domain-containing protein [Halosolutus amylolyticus]
MQDDCDFCRIVAGEDAAVRVFDDDRVLAFLDQRPVTTGHTLVVPKTHGSELFEMDERTVGAVFRTVRRLWTAIDDMLDPIGISVFYTTGSIVGTVEHAHVHLVPRFVDDGVTISLVRDRLDDADGDRLASRLRDAV